MNVLLRTELTIEIKQKNIMSVIFLTYTMTGNMSYQI